MIVHARSRSRHGAVRVAKVRRRKTWDSRIKAPSGGGAEGMTTQSIDTPADGRDGYRERAVKRSAFSQPTLAAARQTARKKRKSRRPRRAARRSSNGRATASRRRCSNRLPDLSTSWIQSRFIDGAKVPTWNDRAKSSGTHTPSSHLPPVPHDTQASNTQPPIPSRTARTTDPRRRKSRRPRTTTTGPSRTVRIRRLRNRRRTRQTPTLRIRRTDRTMPEMHHGRTRRRRKRSLEIRRPRTPTVRSREGSSGDAATENRLVAKTSGWPTRPCSNRRRSRWKGRQSSRSRATRSQPMDGAPPKPSEQTPSKPYSDELQAAAKREFDAFKELQKDPKSPEKQQAFQEAQRAADEHRIEATRAERNARVEAEKRYGDAEAEFDAAKAARDKDARNRYGGPRRGRKALSGGLQQTRQGERRLQSRRT